MGQTLVRLFRENGIDVTVVELNVNTVRSLRERGVRAIYGDAARVETLTEAGVESARVLVLSTPQIQGAREIVRRVRELNPEIRVIARTEYLRECGELCDAGVDQILSDEVEVCLAVTEYVLRDLGATPEQIDRERTRVHRTLFATETGDGREG